MSIYKKASRKKIRFQTERGLIGVEDLWDLSLKELNELAKKLNRKYKEAQEEDFLDESTSVDTTDFKIILDVLNTKKEEKEKRKEYAAKKAQKEKLLEILAAKQDSELNNLSEEEIKAKIAELDS